MAPHIDFLCLAAHVRTFVRNQVDAPAICTRLVLATPAFTIAMAYSSTTAASVQKVARPTSVNLPSALVRPFAVLRLR